MNATTTHSASTNTTVYQVERFDSTQAGNVTPSQTFAVSGGTDLAADDSGNVVLASCGAGVDLYQGGTYVGPIGTASASNVSAIAFDTDGNLHAQALSPKPSLLTYVAPLMANATPSASVNDALGTQYERMSIDGNANIYLSGGDSSAIDVYASGSGSPVRSIVDAAYADDGVVGSGVDAAGNVAIAADVSNIVDVLPAGASGATQAFASYFDIEGSVVDPTAIADDGTNAYVASCQLGSISVFSPGNPSAIRTIVGPATTLRCPNSLALDASGRLFVAEGTAILAFAPGASGNVAPEQVVTTAASPYSFDQIAIGYGLSTSTTSSIFKGMSALLKPTSIARAFRRCTVTRGNAVRTAPCDFPKHVHSRFRS